MIYFIGFIVGILNGLFASGAGQVLVFYLIYIMHTKTHVARTLSVSVLSIASIFALIGFSSYVKYDISKIVVIVIIASISGLIGTKIMKKIPSNVLNLTSGLIIVFLTLYKMLFGK
ncbi:MAG: sulfite exporter TauE/SafE family protein [Clostridia bacterium]